MPYSGSRRRGRASPDGAAYVKRHREPAAYDGKQQPGAADATQQQQPAAAEAKQQPTTQSDSITSIKARSRAVKHWNDLVLGGMDVVRSARETAARDKTLAPHLNDLIADFELFNQKN
jgi:hypothetical protein